MKKGETNNDSRRRVVKSLVSSLGLSGGVVASALLIPETWTRPVVESVILPAHAQTSAAPDPAGPEPPSGQMLFVGRCEDVPDDQYYTVSFTPTPVNDATAQIIVTSQADSNPGTPLDDDLVFFARHLVDGNDPRFLVFVADSGGVDGSLLHTFSCAAGFTQNSLSQTRSLASGNAQLSWLFDFTPGSPPELRIYNFQLI